MKALAWLRGLFRRWQGRCPRCGSVTVTRAEFAPGGQGWLKAVTSEVCGEECGWRRDV